MKRIFKISAMLLFATVFFASCLEDADNDITYYSDTAITSFSVTNFNTYHQTLSSKGEDSIYMVKEDGTKYKFYIDQTRNEIYNPDSLPVGTDAKHVICAIATVRSGNLFIKSATSDSLSTIFAADSLDFSRDRVIKVISLDGKYERSYNVKVNVHKQLADKFVWNIVAKNDIFANADDMKLVARGKDLTAFVKNGDVTSVYTASVSAPKEWNVSETVFDASAYKNAITFGGRYYILSNDKVYVSDDALAWTEQSDASSVTRIVGSDRNNIYALADGVIMISTDGCITWNSDMLADDGSLLPEEDLSFVSSPLITNKEIDRVAIIGNRASVKYASVWNKLVEYTPTVEQHMWNYVEQTPKEQLRLPNLKGLKVISYADGMFAMGGESYDGAINRFQQIYFSKDGGITWLNDKRFIFPFNFLCNNVFAITADEEHNIWLLCGESGQVWRGRLNGLAWENKK